MTIKQMNEEQLAQLFQQTRKSSDQEFVQLNDCSDASEQRISQAELIADDNLQSATHQTLFRLNEWNSAVSQSVANLSKEKESIFERFIFPMLKPALAFAFVAGFAVTLMTDLSGQQQVLQPAQQDRIMFTSSFDNVAPVKDDVISSSPFDSKNNEDVISLAGFG